MAQIVKLRRSSVSGQKPTNSNLQLGELALNTTDGKVYMAKSGSLGPSVEELITTNTVNTGSVSISGSLDLEGTQIISGSLVVTDGVGYINTGLIAENSDLVLTSGSSLLVQDSGSISGSLLYINGTTNLEGNTLISGGLIISSSQNQTPATFQIHGDIRQKGGTYYQPVDITINPLLSGSYLFSSGSTNDLYFAQNTNGYSSLTRLRWLEGNLYTGLLNGGLISATVGGTTFNVSAGSGIIVNLNASLTDDPYPTIKHVKWNEFTGQTLTYRTTNIQTFIGINENGQIVQQTEAFNDGQYNSLITLGTVIHQNLSTVNSSITYPNVAYGYKQRTYDFIKAFGPLKLSGLTIIPTGTLGLNVGSGTAWADGRNYQTDPNNPSYISDPGTSVSKIFRYYQVSGTTFVQDTNNGLGYTTLDVTNYNNNGVITTVPGNNVNNYQWSIQRIFWYPNSATKGIVVYYGNRTYTSATEAAANVQFEPFVEVENTKQNAVYLGAIALRKDANFTDPTTFLVLPGGVFRNVGGSGGGGIVPTSRFIDLIDVDVNGQVNGDLVSYNGTSLKWEHGKSLTGNYEITGSLIITGDLSSTVDGVDISQFSSSVNTRLDSKISSIVIADQGITEGTASYFNFTGNFVTTTVNEGTASILISGNTLGTSQTFTQPTNATTWSIDHTINSRTPVVQIYDSGYNAIIPTKIYNPTPYQTLIYFDVAQSGHAIVSTGGVVSINGSNAILNQTISSDTWTFNHNLNTKYPVFTIFDENDDIIIPLRVNAVDDTTAVIYFSSARTGKAVASVGGDILNPVEYATTGSNTFNGNQIISGSINVTQGITGSLDFGNLINLPSLVSGSDQLTGSYDTRYVISGSITQTTWDNIANKPSNIASSSLQISEFGFLETGSFNSFTSSYNTGSFRGDLFGTASYAMFALSASNAPGFTTNMTQTTAATTWSFVHNLNTRNPIVQVYNENYGTIIPNEIVGINESTVEIRFDYSQSGYAVASNGGGLYITGSTSRINQTSSATTWSFTHNLGTKYPSFEVYDSNDNVIIPAGIKALSTNTAEIYFATPTNGVAIANFSGINGFSENSLTSSLALTTYWDGIINNPISGSLTQSLSGTTTTVMSVETGSYYGAFFDYVVVSGSNSRAGSVMSTWNGTSVVYNEVTTADIGNTNEVTMSVDLSGTEVRLRSTNTNQWSVKSLVRMI